MTAALILSLAVPSLLATGFLIALFLGKAKHNERVEG